MTEPIQSPALPARRKKPGRPSKFTRQTRERILRAVGKGMPLTHAASVANISLQSLITYRRDCPKFAAALEQAVAKGVEKNLEVIERATLSEDEGIRLSAAKWYLEHVHPESFARNRIEVTGANGSPLAAAIAIYLPAKDTCPSTVEVNPPKQIENERR